MERAGAVFVLLGLFAVSGSVSAKKPQKQAAEAAAVVTCGNPVGLWRNRMGSEMKITSFNRSSGAIEGQYKTSSGAPGAYPLIGWVNSSPPAPGMNNAVTIAFSVRWGPIGSITAWTGTCLDSPSGAGLRTLWHLSRPNSQYDWDHILAGADIFNSF
ncbi:avidin/streptavidin family protein [Lysobacter sp. CA196]|uniref:avidin/streptavidin family protein n=1 Tax=Lysobacter sp. CA196 TaxID=3455606 RepID=UPI003F8D85DB